MVTIPATGPEVAEPEGEIGPPWYDGALPVHFRASQSIHQWQPQLNRIFSFEPPPVPAIPNWAAIEKAWPNVGEIRKKSWPPAKLSRMCARSVNSPPGSLLDYAGRQAGRIVERYFRRIMPRRCHGFLHMVSQVSPTRRRKF